MEQSSNVDSGSATQVSVVTVVMPALLMSLVLVVATLGWIIRKKCRKGMVTEVKDEETQFFAINNLSYSIMEPIRVQSNDFMGPGQIVENHSEKFQQSKIRGFGVGELKTHSRGKSSDGREEQIIEQNFSISQMISQPADTDIRGNQKIPQEKRIRQHAFQQKGASDQHAEDNERALSGLYSLAHHGFPEAEATGLSSIAPTSVFQNEFRKNNAAITTNPGINGKLSRTADVKSVHKLPKEENTYRRDIAAGESKQTDRRPKSLEWKSEPVDLSNLPQSEIEEVSSPMPQDRLHRLKKSRRVVVHKKKKSQSRPLLGGRPI